MMAGIETKTNKRKDYLEWEEYFMAMAFLSAMRSKDPSSQVGACIVNPFNRIVAIGYNGMPRGCRDDDLPWAKNSSNILETKYMYVCHAEMNAIMNKNSSDVSGCSIYVALFPCNDCAKIIIQSRIKEVIYYSDKHGDKPEMQASKILLNMAGIPFRKSSACCKISLQFGNNSTEDVGHVQQAINSISLCQDVKRLNYILWEEYFMAVAFLSAQRSKDPEAQIGACIVNQKSKIVGIGYNGMPHGCSEELLPWTENEENRLYRKSMYMCHAEMNAILNKNCSELTDCRLYVTQFPCNECAKLIIQSGISEIVYYHNVRGTSPEIVAAKKMFTLCGIAHRTYDGTVGTVTIDFSVINWNEKN